MLLRQNICEQLIKNVTQGFQCFINSIKWLTGREIRVFYKQCSLKSHFCHLKGTCCCICFSCCSLGKQIINQMFAL